MSTIFISYRHVKPDEDLAFFLNAYLTANGFEVFFDRKLEAGTFFAEEIDQRLKKSDFFIVLISKESIRSDWVRVEVYRAHEYSKRPEGKPFIIPIWVEYDGLLPLDLEAYLYPRHHIVWQNEETHESCGKRILAALANPSRSHGEYEVDLHKDSGADARALFDVTDAIGAPLPTADPRLVPELKPETGTVELDSLFYVKRDADDYVLHQVAKAGSTTIVQGSRQMGKSSLLARIYAATGRSGQMALYLDLQLVGTSQIESLDHLFRYFAFKLAKTCNKSIKIDDHWHTHLGPGENLTDFMEDVILNNIRRPITLLLDEADRTFGYRYRDDFFATLRAWHNRRATEERWRNFNLVIAHSTEPYLWIQDLNQSPFNVGSRIRLEDFDLAQISVLNDKHGKPLKAKGELQNLADLVGGQPYLIRQALYTLATQKWSMTELRTIALRDSGPFGDHLRRVSWAVAQNPDMKENVRQVLNRGMCENELIFQRLCAAGLVKGDSRDRVKMRCELYEEYFRTCM